jgi:hypothetical protein
MAAVALIVADAAKRYRLRGHVIYLDDLQDLAQPLPRSGHVAEFVDTSGESTWTAELGDVCRADVREIRLQAGGAVLVVDRKGRAAFLEWHDGAKAMTILKALDRRRPSRWLLALHPDRVTFVPKTAAEAKHDRRSSVALWSAVVGIPSGVAAVFTLFL